LQNCCLQGVNNWLQTAILQGVELPVIVSQTTNLSGENTMDTWKSVPRPFTPAPDTVYQRFDTILAIEGPWPNGFMQMALTKPNGELNKLLETPGKSFVHIPFEDIRGNVAIITRRGITVHVCNQKAHLKQKLTVVCREAGTITQPELDQLQLGDDYIVDWFGKIETTGLPGAGTRALLEGAAIFVRDASNEPAEARFEVVRIRRWGMGISADAVDGFRVVRILSNLIGQCVYFEGVEKRHEPVVCSFVMDSSGNIAEGYSPDGSLVQHMGPHDHVVIAVRTGQEKGFSAAGSEADVLRKVATMPVPPELRQQTVDAIERCDPSASLLYVIIEDGELTVREVPWSALRTLYE
jgi:hypothetical protein